MARKLLKVMTGLGFLAVAFGMVLWGGYGVGANAAWMCAKLVLVLGVVVYHAYCAVLYRRVASGSDNRSASWYPLVQRDSRADAVRHRCTRDRQAVLSRLI